MAEAERIRHSRFLPASRLQTATLVLVAFAGTIAALLAGWHVAGLLAMAAIILGWSQLAGL